MFRLLPCQGRDANALMHSNTRVEKVMGLPKILSSQSDYRRPKEISKQEETGLVNDWVIAKEKELEVDRQIPEVVKLSV